MRVTSLDRCSLRTDTGEILDPFGIAECGPNWYDMQRRSYKIMLVEDFENMVRHVFKPSHLVNTARRKGVPLELLRAADVDVVRALLLSYGVKGAEAIEFVESRLAEPEAPDVQDTQLDALRDRYEADDFHKVFSLVNALIGGGAPRKKADLYEIAAGLLDGSISPAAPDDADPVDADEAQE